MIDCLYVYWLGDVWWYYTLLNLIQLTWDFDFQLSHVHESYHTPPPRVRSMPIAINLFFYRFVATALFLQPPWWRTSTIPSINRLDFIRPSSKSIILLRDKSNFTFMFWVTQYFTHKAKQTQLFLFEVHHTTLPSLILDLSLFFQRLSDINFYPQLRVLLPKTWVIIFIIFHKRTNKIYGFK